MLAEVKTVETILKSGNINEIKAILIPLGFSKKINTSVGLIVEPEIIDESSLKLMVSMKHLYVTNYLFALTKQWLHDYRHYYSLKDVKFVKGETVSYHTLNYKSPLIVVIPKETNDI